MANVLVRDVFSLAHNTTPVGFKQQQPQQQQQQKQIDLRMSNGSCSFRAEIEKLGVLFCKC